MNSDTRLERIRQNANKYNFEQFQQLLKRSMKEKRVVVDPEDRNDLQKAIAVFKSGEDEETRELTDRITRLAELLGAEVNSQPGIFVVKNTDLTITITLGGSFITSCTLSLFESDAIESNYVKDGIHSGNWKDTAEGLLHMLQVFPKEMNTNDKAICLKCLSVLETDFSSLSKSSYVKSADKELLKHCRLRTESNSFTFILLNAPPLYNLLGSTSVGSFTYKAYLGVTNESNAFPLPTESMLRDDDGVPKWSPDYARSEVPAQFCLYFSSPVCASSPAFSQLSNLKGLTYNVLHRPNYLQQITGNHQDVVNMSTLSPKVTQTYFVEEANTNEEGALIDKITFTNPRNVLTALAILRRELLFTALFQSFCKGAVSTVSTSGKPLVSIRVKPNHLFCDSIINYGEVALIG
jgi:hypothetical protein